MVFIAWCGGEVVILCVLGFAFIFQPLGFFFVCLLPI